MQNRSERTQGARPRRGTPPETRARLVAAAAAVINRVGYRGTDSNRIARAAGYAPGTFYKHFPDKRTILLAAYEEWVTAEWRAIEAALQAGGSAEQLARRSVDLVLRWHRRWRGLRSSLLSLAATDMEVRRFYRQQRRRQLRMLSALRAAVHGASHTAEEDAVLLFTLERTGDAVASGELRDLGLRRTLVVKLLHTLVQRYLTQR